MLPTISPLAERDAAAVSELAGIVWRRHYPGIISAEQIEYMLAQRYRPALIAAQLASGEIRWDKLVLAGEILGFSCCLPDEPGVLKLDKLYVHPDHQRKGYGGMLVAAAIATARSRRCTRLVLAVNKRNAAAIAAYRRYGFTMAGAATVDIGGGFMMDDYIMATAVPE